MKLRIAENLTLPIDAVTEKLAFLGRTGSGKTYAAMKLAELMLEAGAQIVSLDPVGAWHGLRIGGPWNVYIFGGMRGDFPLEPTGGKLMADLIADRGISAVLDVSQFIRAEQVRLASDFIERFFFRKKALPSAVHVFLEEAQEFVPQNPGDREAHMLHHFERAWKLGRNFGIGGSIISQRPQEINKKALNQAGTLFVFNMTGPQERKAIADWTRQAGIDEDIESVLPMLKTGEPHVWSPTFLEVSKTVKILPKLTADVSMTPKVGARTKEQPLTPIDVEKLTAEMAATIEKSKADDPKELRKQIAQLKKRISDFEIRKPEPAKVERVEVSVLTDDDRKLLQDVSGSVLIWLSRLGSSILASVRQLNFAAASYIRPRTHFRRNGSACIKVAVNEHWKLRHVFRKAIVFVAILFVVNVSFHAQEPSVIADFLQCVRAESEVALNRVLIAPISRNIQELIPAIRDGQSSHKPNGHIRRDFYGSHRARVIDFQDKDCGLIYPESLSANLLDKQARTAGELELLLSVIHRFLHKVALPSHGGPLDVIDERLNHDGGQNQNVQERIRYERVSFSRFGIIATQIDNNAKAAQDAQTDKRKLSGRETVVLLALGIVAVSCIVYGLHGVIIGYYCNTKTIDRE